MTFDQTISTINRDDAIKGEDSAVQAANMIFNRNSNEKAVYQQHSMFDQDKMQSFNLSGSEIDKKQPINKNEYGKAAQSQKSTPQKDANSKLETQEANFPVGTKSIVYTSSIIDNNKPTTLGNICLGWFKGETKKEP